MLLKFKKQLFNSKELYLRIKIYPSASKNEIKDIMDDETLKIGISAPPVKGKANQELIKFLAREFAVSKNNVKIISGAWERVKLIKIIKK